MDYTKEKENTNIMQYTNTNSTGWTGRENYEERKAAKVEYYEEKAAQAMEKAESLQKPFNEHRGDIAFLTQPNINSSSGRSFTNYRNRVMDQYEKSFEEMQKAAYYEEKAEKYASNKAISSDDPEAIRKLKEKLEACEKSQEEMKAVNKALRIKDEEKGNKKLLEMGYTEKQIQQLREPDFIGRIGYPDYALSNNNAEIRRLKDRIKELEDRAAAPAPEGWEFNGGKVVANISENRYQIIFDSIPDENIRSQLKRHGFKWSRYNGAWQRMISRNTEYVLKHYFEFLKPISD